TDLAATVFHLTETGPVSRDFLFRNQIREAADAPAPLIAEGFKRFTTPEFVRYLRMACGELAEVQTQLIEGEGKGYFAGATLGNAQTLARRAIGTTTNLLKSKLRKLAVERRERERASRRRRSLRRAP
ncbi:MAG TPA: four helix bundle protein, partial [Vicinamibacterales bacterium]|nr:four helix bundle protein [Vicinamibacterales bacterium]